MKDLNGFYKALERAEEKNNESFFRVPGRCNGIRCALQTFRELQTVADALKAGRTITTINMQVINVVTAYEIPVKPDGIGWIIGQ